MTDPDRAKMRAEQAKQTVGWTKSEWADLIATTYSGATAHECAEVILAAIDAARAGAVKDVITFIEGGRFLHASVTLDGWIP